MKLRSLVVSDDARRSLAAVIEYAKAPENWSRITRTNTGTINPKYNRFQKIMLDRYECVFSYAISMCTLYRRLEVTTDTDALNRLDVLSIARLFEFDGSPQEWVKHTRDDGHGVVFAQEVPLCSVSETARASVNENFPSQRISRSGNFASSRRQ